MTDKPKYLWFLLLLSALTQCQQDPKEKIKMAFSEFMNSIRNRDVNTFVNYIPDAYFQIASKEQTILDMQKSFTNPDTELKEVSVLEIEDGKLIEGKHYSLLKYSKRERLSMKRTKDQTEDDYKTLNELRKELFEIEYGAENVVFNDSSKSFEIYMEELACAMSINGRTNWKFLLVDQVDRSILEKLLPKQLVDSLQNSR